MKVLNVAFLVFVSRVVYASKLSVVQCSAV